jgi:hypothetical protein
MVKENDFGKHRDTLEVLCIRALEGVISLDDFYRAWPCNKDKGSFCKVLYDDLEDAIQHTPGTWFAGKIDLSKWKQCYEYFVVYLDLLLLKSGENPTKLLEVRKITLSEKKISVSVIDDIVKREFRTPS